MPERIYIKVEMSQNEYIRIVGKARRMGLPVDQVLGHIAPETEVSFWGERRPVLQRNENCEQPNRSGEVFTLQKVDYAKPTIKG